MELRAEFFHARHPENILVVQHIRVQAAKADTLNAGHLGGFLNQFHQACAAVGAVAGQADGRQHDLFIACVGQTAQFFQHAGLVAAAHRAAGAGNDAVGTAAVAAILDLDKGAGVLGELIHGQLFKPFSLLVGTDIYHTLLLAVQHLLHIVQNRVPVAGAGHNVSLGNLGGLLGESLGVAAGQHRHRAGVLALGAAQPLTAFLVTEIRDGAAVDDIDIGPFLVGDDGVAVFLKQLCQCASFVLIYLAAQGVKSYPHGFVSFTYRIAFLL